MLKVSVIIPVYNVSEYIEQCLVSVFTQSYTNLQVILVDDCGSDNSMQIAQDVIGQYSSFEIVVVTQPRNMGQSAARNIATSRADGDYILYLDSDDYLPQEAIEKLVSATNNGEKELVLGDYTNIDCMTGIKTYLSTIDYERLKAAKLNKPWSNYDYWPVTQVAPWNKLIKRTLTQQNDLKFTEGVIYEDLFWCLKLLFATTNIEHLRQSTYMYRLRQNSTMTSIVKPRNIESYIRFFDDSEEFLKSHSSQIGDENKYKWLLASVDSRRVVVLKQLTVLNGVSMAQKISYLERIRPKGRVPELKLLALPRYSRLVGYALSLPKSLSMCYLRIIHAIKR